LHIGDKNNLKRIWTFFKVEIQKTWIFLRNFHQTFKTTNFHFYLFIYLFINENPANNSVKIKILKSFLSFRINPNLGQSFLVTPIAKFLIIKWQWWRDELGAGSKLHDVVQNLTIRAHPCPTRPEQGALVFHTCSMLGSVLWNWKIPSHHSLFKQWLIIAYHFSIFSFEEILYPIPLRTYLPIMKNFDNKNDMKFIHHQTRVIQAYASVTYVVGLSLNQLHN
jgi:hypothetical protein